MVTGSVGVIELARPSKLNILTPAGFETIRAAVDDFERPDSGVWAVLVKASGQHFCTGADLEDTASMARDRHATDEYLTLVQTALRRLESSPLPVVAACQGLVLAGGLELALCCGVVLAADDAQFGDQHVTYGLVPAWAGSPDLLHRPDS